MLFSIVSETPFVIVEAVLVSLCDDGEPHDCVAELRTILLLLFSHSRQHLSEFAVVLDKNLDGAGNEAAMLFETPLLLAPMFLLLAPMFFEGVLVVLVRRDQQFDGKTEPFMPLGYPLDNLRDPVETFVDVHDKPPAAGRRTCALRFARAEASGADRMEAATSFAQLKRAGIPIMRWKRWFDMVKKAPFQEVDLRASRLFF